jgi:hypothetical protein
MSLPYPIYDPSGLAVRRLIVNPGGLQAGLSTAPAILVCDGIPSEDLPAGSLALSHSGAIYRRSGGAWLELASSSESYLAVSTPGALSASYRYFDLSGAGSYTLPSPVSGRRLEVSSSVAGVVIDAGAGKQINNAQTYSLSQWESITLIGTGSNWRIY